MILLMAASISAFSAIVAFAQTDNVKTAREWWSGRFQLRIRARIERFSGHVHHDRIDALQFEIAIGADWIGITAKRNALLFQET